MIRGARLLELRVDTPQEVREQWLGAAPTAMDALCGLCDREGTDAVWDVLEMLDLLSARARQRLRIGVEWFQSFHEKRLARQRLKFARWVECWRKSDLSAAIAQSA